MPPNPDLEAEMLTRLMQRFGAPAPVATAAVASTAPTASPTAARQGAPREERRRLVEARRRRRVRPRLAPRGTGARPHRLHRRRPRSLHAACTSCAMPIPTATSRRHATRAGSRSSCSGSRTRRNVPSSTGSRSIESRADSRSSPCRIRTARRTRRANGEKILALLATSCKWTPSRCAVMRFASLGSGSEGNGLVVEAGAHRGS